MRRGWGTLGVAYIVVIGLYAGAMYVASNRSAGDDIGLIASTVYEEARDRMSLAADAVPAMSSDRESGGQGIIRSPAPVAVLRPSIPAHENAAEAGAEIALFISTPGDASAAPNRSGDEPANKTVRRRSEFSDVYFGPIAEAQLTLDVEGRLRERLTSDLFAQFDLFIYVSKAGTGPWAQNMYVFAKDGGDLDLVHNWPVSTGRERAETTPSGRKTSSVTPAGYFQFDRNRMFRHYRSVQWDAPMPNAMFFNWMDRGMLTGIAIHGVVGQQVSDLGTRASAGCIRLSPEAAAALFKLVRDDYRGAVPSFAYDRATASLSRNGSLARNASGSLQYTDGYRALIIVDTYGGGEAEHIF